MIINRDNSKKSLTKFRKSTSILLVVAPYYGTITDKLVEGAKEIVDKANVKIELINVPGALEIPTAIKFALFPNSKKRPKTLVDKFYYPRLGAGMLWEKFEEHITNKNIEVTKNKKVTAVKRNEDKFLITYEDTDGNKTTIESINVFFSNPLLEFIAIYDAEVPQAVINSAKSLNYRNHISVHLSLIHI